MGIVGTRLLLDWLGDVDYGLIGALGATGALLSFLQVALTSSSQRHFAYEIGKKDWDELSRVFFTAWVMFLLLGVGLWVMGECLTPVVLGSLKIPEDRAHAAWWVYQLSLASVVLTVWGTPFRAMLTAHQEIIVTSTAEAMNGVLRFAAVLSLLVVPWDLMVSFVALQLLGLAIVQTLLVAWCIANISSCRFHLRLFDRQAAKRILHFAGWNSLGNLSVSLRFQGGALLITAFFGPAVNAANMIAMQVTTYVLSFQEAIRIVAQPVIIGAEARGDRKTVHQMTIATPKYTVLLLALGFVPILLETEQLLGLWLVSIPDDALVLLRLSVVWAFIQILCTGHVVALQGTGNIGWLMRIVLAVSVLMLGGTALCYYLGGPVWCLPLVTIVGMLALLVVVVVGIGQEIDLPPRVWAEKTLLPIVKSLLPATLVAASLCYLLPPSLGRLIGVTLAFNLIAAPLIWRVGLELWERQQFARVLGLALSRVTGK